MKDMLKDPIRADNIRRRFESKVTKRKPNQCWEWRANRHRQGYGFFRLGRRMELAHRVAYLLAKGDPGELGVLHTCDNPCCVNPRHLKLGTQLDNMHDASRKGRLALPLAIIRRIRRRIRAGAREIDLLRELGISRGTSYRIRYNISYQLVK